jgi:hypothetical protein
MILNFFIIKIIFIIKKIIFLNSLIFLKIKFEIIYLINIIINENIQPFQVEFDYANKLQLISQILHNKSIILLIHY